MGLHDLTETLRLSGGRTDDATPPVAHLFLVMECARPLAGGARWSLEGIDEVDVGRGPTRTAAREGRRLVVRVPDPSVSAVHARLLRVGAGWAVVDPGSTNGTIVDGQRVARAPLNDGALLALGSTLFTVKTAATPREALVNVDLDGSDATTTLLPTYARSLESLRQVMRSRLPVLLLGESGTGKEVLARAVHASSGRSGPWVAVNCGAIPETLVESQLFGHARGAFSGAVRDEPGLIRSSEGGTLFLDEIGDLPRTSQAALLRVLQEREVLSVGSTRAVRVDLRIVSATHRRVDALQGDAFRADLYARLAGYVHELPPLRERREDMGLLVSALLRALAPERAGRIALSVELGTAIVRHAWPLNVRELEHALASSSCTRGSSRSRTSPTPCAPVGSRRRRRRHRRHPSAASARPTPASARCFSRRSPRTAAT
jgi:hypothetical protein